MSDAVLKAAKQLSDADVVAIGKKHGLSPDMARVFHAVLSDGYRAGYASGYAAAREQAAGIAHAKAEEWWSDNSEKHYRTASLEIENSIRAMTGADHE